MRTLEQINPYVFALLIMLLAALVSYLLDWWFLPKLATLLILQLGVATVALRGDRLPAVLAALIGALSFNYLFTQPRYSLHMTDADDIVNMLVFLVIALLTSHLAAYYRSQQEALRQAQLRSSVLLSVSHDLRTPLATIIGTLSTLQSYAGKLPGEDQQELLQGALDESHRLHRYIENLLQATKLQQGQMRFSTTMQSVAPIVQAVVSRLDNPRVKVRLDTNLPDVPVRESLLEQALYNLVDNALKYSESEVSIVVKADLNGLDIQVKDQGPGIPAADHSKVFELFYSTRKGDKGEGGTGLGLAVAAGIVRAHQGQLAILASTQGCTMGIRLPLQQGDRHA
ncbi:sensor histidine kinase [Bowmanella denitrificans]|uniref:sensor histidine kinase n=1 Tax=Bowmanella denitrificans TaxID=366582 RepID=UPI001FE49FF3|nr:DUF4118 domain-containing protein [Bowmanella denitrificans]